MAGADFIIKQGDVLPVLTDTLTYSDGSPANLTGATVFFVMRPVSAPAPTTNSAATVTNSTAGAVSYTFTATDTASAGLFIASWVVTFSGGQQQQWPTDGYLDIWVEENLTSSASEYLVSLADIKDHLNIQAGDRTHDQKLMRWLMAVTPTIEAITGPIVPRLYDEWYDGGNYSIRLRHRPATALLSCNMKLGPVDYPMAIIGDPIFGQIYSVMLDPTGDRVLRRGPGGGVIGFPAMPDSVHVVYQAGISPTPENVRMGTLLMLQDNWNPSQEPGPSRGPSTFADDDTPTAESVGFLMSPRVREFLTPNRRAPSIF